MRDEIIFTSFLLLFFLSACDFDKSVKQMGLEDEVHVKCDAETWKDGMFIDQSGVYQLSNAAGRTTGESRSGSYSLKLVEESPYGMSLVLRNVHPDDYFRVTAWKKGDGHVCASDDTPGGFFLAENEPVESDNSGWEKVVLEFYVPYNYEHSGMKILLANFGSAPVYFDDLTITRERKRNFPEFDRREVLNIFVTETGYQKLKRKRDEALSEGLLMKGEDDWVKALIFYKNDVLDAKVRLKGDRVDHLQGEKWSFRINLKGESSWKGMTTFSIQTPKARNFMHEWFFHQALQQEDLLCTGYGFVPVALNGRSLGVYAWEEHFEKHLVESRGRREGPVLKMSDNSYWILDKKRRQGEVSYSIPYYDAAVIQPFDEDNLVENPLLLSQFRNARDLYQQYKYARANASELFDIDAVAKYYAMVDATNAYHTLHFFNQRFYFNPILGKLEPVFFDSFSDVGIFDYNGTSLIIGKAREARINVHLKMFADPAFRKRYFKYLEEYSSRDFWETLSRQKKNETDSLNRLLQREYGDYHFDPAKFCSIAGEAKHLLDSLQEHAPLEKLFDKFENRSLGKNRGYTGKADFELIPHLVNVYRQGPREFRLENYSTDTVLITGFSDIPQLETEKTAEELVVPPANKGEKYFTTIATQRREHQYLFLKVRDQKISIPVIPRGAPREPAFLEVNQVFDSLALHQKEHAQFSNDSVVFEGVVKVRTNLVIPSGKQVVFKKGTRFDLTDSATFISYSPLFVRGTENEPVLFSSSDQTGKGINVFKAGQRSVIRNAQFSGLTNLQFGGWTTTAGVCFYESDVNLINVHFKNNVHCDDALNIVRSSFFMEQCVFEKAWADAFDADFCKGTIENSRFLQPGNDGVDFSGSEVEVRRCSIIDAGDKGVSCGEKSTVAITGCSIRNANIGVASKDRSVVKIADSEMDHVTYGLVAFCKKPVYGPARIVSRDVMIKNYLFIHLIEEASLLTFNGREIYGQEKDLAGRFY